MFEIFVKKVNSDIVIRWLLSKITIPICDILTVTTDDTYGGKEKQAIRIGMPYGTTDRVVIITNENTYILFTTNYISIQKKLNSYIHSIK
ncbi:SunI/YnzG family protein [Paenisporosarcina antarctica]|uniref:Sublancin immunity protein SunI-like PH domain-containing protein n=1 Tax=Paenisporosarcina antarctica TaxID=417367 RepID=A0A4P7A2A5_9BACL|nr:hypothetical protein [Paenisporosarcina antarctica]QBP42056.1 hypothetical protein E2636_13260 [Paenisporosarcina antarctica]